MRIWRVLHGGHDEIAKVVAGDEPEARDVWRSYLYGSRVTEPGPTVGNPFVMWVDPEWDARISSGALPEGSPAMQSWRGSDFLDDGPWYPGS